MHEDLWPHNPEAERYIPPLAASIGRSGLVLSDYDGGVDGSGHTPERLAEVTAEVGNFIQITGYNDLDKWTLEKAFTPDELVAMSDTLKGYLGGDWQSFKDSGYKGPRDYSTLVDRLSGYFYSSDSSVMSSFGAFERRHTDPQARTPRGPKQSSQRRLANVANESILYQLKQYYGMDFDINLVGEMVRDTDGTLVWAPGVAECQFLLLDSIRNSFSRAVAANGDAETLRTMSLGDIEHNIRLLLTQRDILVAQTSVLSSQLGQNLDRLLTNLHELTEPTFYRGRADRPTFQKIPHIAEKRLREIEHLLVHAEAIVAISAEQEEIPELEI